MDIEVGELVFSRERIKVVRGGQFITSFSLDDISGLRVVHASVSENPRRELLWGGGMAFVGLVFALRGDGRGQVVTGLVIAAIGVWLLVRLAKNRTYVQVSTRQGTAYRLGLGVELDGIGMEELEARLRDELGYPSG